MSNGHGLLAYRISLLSLFKIWEAACHSKRVKVFTYCTLIPKTLSDNNFESLIFSTEINQYVCNFARRRGLLISLKCMAEKLFEIEQRKVHLCERGVCPILWCRRNHRPIHLDQLGCEQKSMATLIYFKIIFLSKALSKSKFLHIFLNDRMSFLFQKLISSIASHCLLIKEAKKRFEMQFCKIFFHEYIEDNFLHYEIENGA